MGDHVTPALCLTGTSLWLSLLDTGESSLVLSMDPEATLSSVQFSCSVVSNSSRRGASWPWQHHVEGCQQIPLSLARGTSGQRVA